MAAANPYAQNLGNRDPREMLAGTPQHLRKLFHQLSPDGLERSYAPAKWTARMILCHLADCEIAFSYRFRQILAEPHHVMQLFDQDAWAQPYNNPSLDAATALNVFSALRGWNLLLVSGVPRELLSKPASHPERGETTFENMLGLVAGHDLNHLRQLETIASKL